MSRTFIDKILSEVSLDRRVSNGIFSIEEDTHMEALREFLVNKGLTESDTISFSNKVLEGKYPERQAYNTKGILVTFPTPEYKAAAIKKGTHFEKNPSAKAQNVFQHTPHASGEKAPEPTAANVEKADAQPSKTNLPVSQAAPPESDATDETEPVQAFTTAAPQQTPTPTAAQTEPVTQPTEPPPPTPKSPEEKVMDKNVIKTMLKGDDYMLEEVTKFVMYNGAPYLIELIKSKLYER